MRYLANFDAHLKPVDGFEAVSGFLRSYSNVEATFVSYRTHAERLRPWAFFIRKKPLMGLPPPTHDPAAVRQLADGTGQAREWVHKPSAAQDAHNMQSAYFLGTDISNVPWLPTFQFVGYLKAPNAGVTVNRGAF